MSLVKIVVFVAIAALLEANAFEHTNQATWSDMDAECHLDRQSPIELNSHDATKTLGIPEIDFDLYSIPLLLPSTITNNGNTADIQLPKTSMASISKGPLGSSRYRVESIHTHWASQNHHGSEHVVDGQRFSMEMHIVHRNTKYSSVAEATQHKDGLAVLGIFFQVDPDLTTDFAGLNKITSALGSINGLNTSSRISALRLSTLLGDINTKEFFTYPGSLTTPDCSRAVTWILFKEPISITESQMESFRSLKDKNGDALVNNYRFLQAKGDRQVFLRTNV